MNSPSLRLRRTLGRSFAQVALAVALPGALASAQGTLLIAGPAGDASAHFTGPTAIAEAVAVSGQGGVVLVRTGTYLGFTIDGRSVGVIADEGALVTVQDPLGCRVENVSAGGRVILSGLQHVADEQVPALAAPLALRQCAGTVWVQDATIETWRGPFAPYNAEPAVTIEDCTSVTFQDCVVTSGLPTWVPDGAIGDPPAVRVSGSNLHLFDSEFRGGAGSAGTSPLQPAGAGEPALELVESFVFASACHFTGGAGGQGFQGDGECTNGGTGGVGLLLQAGEPEVVLRQGKLYGGAPGPGGTGCAAGLKGQPMRIESGTLSDPKTLSRQLRSPPVVREDEHFTLRFEGLPGDLVLYSFSPATDPQYVSSLLNSLLLLQPSPFYLMGEILSPYGKLEAESQLTSLPAGFSTFLVFQQAAFFNLTEGFVLSSGRALLMLDASIQ